MPTWLLLVLLILATFRLTRFVTEDELIAGWRDDFEAAHDNLLGYLVRCPHCVSVYASALVVGATWVVLNWWGDGMPLPILMGAAVAGGTSLTFTLIPAH